jgi:uncharacterized protein (TIRG00374 family)
LIKKALSVTIKVVISVTLILLLFQQREMNLGDIFHQLRNSNEWWLLAGLILFTGSTFLGAIQWRMLLQARNIEIPVSKVISFYYIGLFFNNFLPGYVAGDAFRIYDITKSSGNNSDAVSTVLLDRIIGFIVLTTLALVASLVWMSLTRISTTLFLVILGIFLGWLFALFIFFNVRVARKFQFLFNFFNSEKILLKAKSIYWGINAFRNHKKLLLKTILISIIIQSFRVLTHYVAARAVGIDQIHPFYFFIFIPMVALAVTIPISIGGFGVREQIAVNLFCLPGIGGVPNLIILMEFMSYLIGVICSLPGGLLFITRKKNQQ